ncbi:MAG: glycosyltransferase family 4 protein [Solirubrobacteraceae bacterium]
MTMRIAPAIIPDVRIALLTNRLVPYRMPLYARLAAEHDLEVLCYGGGERYTAAGTGDDPAALAAAPFPARTLDGWRGALTAGRNHDLVIAGYAGGPVLAAAYLGARRHRRRFVLWASVWAQPRSLTNDLAVPVTRHIYRHADAVIAYGEHVRRYVGPIRGRDDDIVIAPQSVEPELFGRAVDGEEIAAFRARHALGDGPLMLFAGRLAQSKGVGVLAQAWPQVSGAATLVVAGDGPLRAELERLPGVRVLGALTREELVVADAAATALLVPSIPTPRFLEPWGLVVNEAMHQGTAVIATTAVGAAAGGLVSHGETGLVIAPGDPAGLAAAVDRLLADPDLRERLGAAGRAAVSAYTYEAMAAAFARALQLARAR